MSRAGRAARIRGLYGIADARAFGDPVRAGADWLAGGCRIVQVRCKGWTPDALEEAARALRVRCDAVGALLIVNDDPHVAVSADADGVHVGQTDASTEEVRRIVGPDRLIGRSTNRLAHLDHVDGDYVAFGPVWPTGNVSRPKEVQGLDALRAARAAVRGPLVAIGGVTAERLPALVALGVDAWAVIGAVATAADRVAAARALTGAPR